AGLAPQPALRVGQHRPHPLGSSGYANRTHIPVSPVMDRSPRRFLPRHAAAVAGGTTCSTVLAGPVGAVKLDRPSMPANACSIDFLEMRSPTTRMIGGPRRVAVRVTGDGMPAAVAGRPVECLRDEWRVDEGWWTGRP